MVASHRLTNICIIGNIGSGKSTLTKFLGAAVPNSIAVLENFDDNPFLPLYVADPPRWGFANAVRYFYDYVRMYQETVMGRVFEHYFIDAGGATNRGVYGRYLANERIITPEESAFHEMLCDIITRAYAYPEPDAYIFIHCAPETCFERMKKRGWAYQTENIALAYIAILEKYIREYQAILEQQGLPVLELDSDGLDFMSEDGQAEVLERVRAFLGEASR